MAATSPDDVIESADTAEPLAQRVADAGVSHVTGELAEAGVECRLKCQERGVRQEEDLVQEGQDHVGPRLQEPRFTDQYRVKGTHADVTCSTLFLHMLKFYSTQRECPSEECNVQCNNYPTFHQTSNFYFLEPSSNL